MFAPIYARLCRDLAASAGIQRDLTTACKHHFMENYQQLLHYNNIFEVRLLIMLFIHKLKDFFFFFIAQIEDCVFIRTYIRIYYPLSLQGPISSRTIHEEILARKRFIGHLK